MSIDLKKYDHIVFSEDKGINKKIRAYMVLFDYQCYINGFNDKQKVDTLVRWESVLLKEEFYEIIPCLTYRREKVEARIKYDSLSVIQRMAHKLSELIQGLKNKKGKK